MSSYICASLTTNLGRRESNYGLVILIAAAPELFLEEKPTQGALVIKENTLSMDTKPLEL